MTVIGKYVAHFAEASHALPDGMHMNADYPFMLPHIVELDAKTITIEGRSGVRETCRIRRTQHGHEYAHVAQRSSFETMMGRQPTRFTLRPFKDYQTPAVAAPQDGET